MHEPTSLGPGIHRVDRLAGAELGLAPAAPRCTTTAEVDRLLASDPAEVNPAELDDLSALAARAMRAQAIVERTQRRAVIDANQRLAGGAALAVHPEAVRARARAVTEAREALVAAERALADHDVADEAPSPADGPPPHDAPVQLRTRRNQAVGLVVASFGLALVLLATRVLPLWAALLIPFGTSVMALRLLAGGAEPSGAVASANLLAEVDAFTGAADRSSSASRRSEREQLEIARRLAQEELRVADRSWHDLVGDDAAVEDLDAVVARFDPQHDAAEAVAAESVSVRAVTAAAQGLAGEWRQRWEAMGRTVPPLEAAAVEAALASLVAAEPPVVILTGPAAARAEEVVRRWPAAVVLVEA